MKRSIQLSISDMAEGLVSPDNPPEGVTVSDPKKTMSLDGEGLLTLSFLLQLAAGVPFGILANWLYDKYFRAKPASSPKKITINHTTHVFVRQEELVTILDQEVHFMEGE